MRTQDHPLLAVFWYTDQGFIGFSQGLRGINVDCDGRYLYLPFKHYELWCDYDTFGEDVAFNFFPRGKISFKIPIHQFVVTADKRITENEETRNQILDHYNLPPTTIFETDEHYQ